MLFIGFPTLEGLLANYREVIGSPGLESFPLYALSHSVPAHSSIGITRYSTRLTVSFVDEDQLVYYWSMPLGVTDYLNGTPVTDDAADRHAAREQVWQFALDYLRALGHTVVEALVAVPKELQLLDGSTSLIEFDRATGAYRPAPCPDPICK